MHSESLSEVAAEQVRKHRKRLRINREELAEECARLGMPSLTTAAITSIETGRRDPKTGRRRREVSIDELMILGHALAVPPLLLMLPLGEVDEVPVPPGPSARHPHAVWNWAIGEEPPAVLGDDGLLRADMSRIREGGPSRLEAWRSSNYAVVLYQRLWAAETALGAADALLRTARQFAAEDSKQVRDAKQERYDRLAEFGQVLDEMISAGIRTPAVGREWVDALREQGLLKHLDAVRSLDGESTREILDPNAVRVLEAEIDDRLRDPEEER